MLQAEVAVLSVASRWWYFFGGGSICFAHRDPSAGAVRFPLKTQRRVPNVGVAAFHNGRPFCSMLEGALNSRYFMAMEAMAHLVDEPSIWWLP